MPTPLGQISMSDVRLEIYGSATGEISLNDVLVRELTADDLVPTSMSELQNRTWACTWTPNANSSSADLSGGTEVSYACSSTKTSVWTYSVLISHPDGMGASFASGGSGRSITFIINPTVSGTSRTGKWQVSATSGKLSSATFTITLQNRLDGGPGGPPGGPPP